MSQQDLCCSLPVWLPGQDEDSKQPVHQALDSEGCEVWARAGVGLVQGLTLCRTPRAIPLGRGIRQLGKQKMHVGKIDTFSHTTLASTPQLWEENVPSGRYPTLTKGPLLDLEVRICGR